MVSELKTTILHHSLMEIVTQVLSKSIATVRKMHTTLWKESQLNLFAQHESENLHDEFQLETWLFLLWRKM